MLYKLNMTKNLFAIFILLVKEIIFTIYICMLSAIVYIFLFDHDYVNILNKMRYL
jgi:hypothetical protein